MRAERWGSGHAAWGTSPCVWCEPLGARSPSFTAGCAFASRSSCHQGPQMEGFKQEPSLPQSRGARCRRAVPPPRPWGWRLPVSSRAWCCWRFVPLASTSFPGLQVSHAGGGDGGAILGCGLVSTGKALVCINAAPALALEPQLPAPHTPQLLRCCCRSLEGTQASSQG